ncbi:hypothetical protein [Coleofasciculus sp. E1-EBD-02]|uniref:hypothetical protein n=1 Tax=Coleofasciculus sp. E1-EBD-02 TaxID=3068481 RepID=UPI003300EC4A
MTQFYQYKLNLFPEASRQDNIIGLENQRLNQAIGLFQQSPRFGFDLETFSRASTPAIAPETGEIRLIQIAIEQPAVQVIVIDLGWTAKERSRIHQKLESLGFWTTLQERLANPQVEVVGHSLDFEQRWMLAKYNFPIRNLRDTKLMSQVYWAGLDPWLLKQQGKPHSLESVCLRLGISIDKSRQTSDWGWGDLGNGQLSNNQFNYAANDASITLKVHDLLEPRLKEIRVWTSYLIECAASPAFAQMSHYGMPVDEGVLADVTVAYEAAYQSLVEQLGRTFSECLPHLYSPKKLVALINRRFRVTLKSANVDDLSKLWGIVLSDESAKNSIKAWRQTYKVLASFQQSIVEKANHELPSVLGINPIQSRSKFGLGYVRCLTGRGVFLPKWRQNVEDGREQKIEGKRKKFNGLYSTLVSVKSPDANAAYWTMCEADIIKTFLAYCVAAFDAHPEWEAWVGNCCHDEADIFGKEEFGVEIASAVQMAMERAMGIVIQDIPVSEDECPERLLGNCWTDK